MKYCCIYTLLVTAYEIPECYILLLFVNMSGWSSFVYSFLKHCWLHNHALLFLAILVMNAIQVILLKYVVFTGYRPQSSLGLGQRTVELPHIRFGGKVGSYLE